MLEVRAGLCFPRFAMRLAAKPILCRVARRNWQRFTRRGQRVRWGCFIKGTDFFMVCRWRSMRRPQNWSGGMVFSNPLTVRTEARCRARADLRALPSGREKRAQRANASSRSLLGTMIEDFMACVALAGTACAGSAKREFFRKWPETFRHFDPETGRTGAWRPSRIREKPGFPGL